MKYLTVRHETRYSYTAPVKFGTHRLMLRPRDSHDLRLVGAELTLSPPGETRWMHDVFGNSVAQVEFGSHAAELLVVSTLHLEHFGLTRGRSQSRPKRRSILSSIRRTTAAISAACSTGTIPIRTDW